MKRYYPINVVWLCMMVGGFALFIRDGDVGGLIVAIIFTYVLWGFKKRTIKRLIKKRGKKNESYSRTILQIKGVGKKRGNYSARI